MTFIEGLRLLLDMAARTKLKVVAGYDKSKDKTESCKKQSVAQRSKVYRRSLSNDTTTSSNSTCLVCAGDAPFQGKFQFNLLNKTLGRARDPHTNGAWLSKLTE